MLLLMVFKVCGQLRRTASASHYSVPLALIVVAGLVHAGFEDWLFAVGSYLCVFFWVAAFMLIDVIPPKTERSTIVFRSTSRMPTPHVPLAHSPR